MMSRRLGVRRARLTALALGSVLSLALPSEVDAQTQAPPKEKPPATPAAPAPATPPAPAGTPAPTTPPLPSTPAPTPGEDAASPTAEPGAAPPPLEPGRPPQNAGMPLWPEPSADAAALQQQGDTRPSPKAGGKIDEGDRVYAEDWWSHARPVFELHGYFRVRAQLFHKFGIGRLDPLARAMWPRPPDDRHYVTTTADNSGTVTGVPVGAQVCTPEENGGVGNDPANAVYPCRANMQSGANMRFRLNPELHISDNLRVLSQVDLLDNLVLGSTPSGFDNMPSADGGYAVSPNSGYAPLGFYDDTQVPPSAGKNSFSDSIRVKRAWGEYAMPIGELRFGRMPFHWGLGIMFNGGDGYDDDAQSTVDRAQVISGIKPLDLYVSAAWDFPNEGISSDSTALPNPEPYDLANLDDVDQYTFSVARMKSPELERLSLARNEVVLNGGVQLVYRAQTVGNDRSGDCQGEIESAAPLGCNGDQISGGYVWRDAHAWIPSLWVRLRYDKFRFEGEVVTVQGHIANIDPAANITVPGDPGYDIATWGLATELEYKLLEDRLDLGFKFGWAQGDADVDGLSPTTGGSQAQLGDRTFEQFRFHPSYRVDMILNRNLLTRIQGTYYFRPSADYDFLRDASGQRAGGGIAAIWTRASEFIQAPGHERDLGIELNGRIFYQSKDGALNDIPGVMGGFFTEINYGVLFPMAGLGYTAKQANMIASYPGLDAEAATTRIAQTLRWYLGIMF